MRKRTSGYALVFVMLLGVVLASLSGILLYATSRDNNEARQQLGNAKAVYAAEGAVAVGIERVRSALEQNPQPALAPLEATPPTLTDVTFDTFRIRYYDTTTNTTSTTPPSSPVFAAIKGGPNAGLFASQTPIQVLATARVGKSAATVADAIRIDLIPIFQFAIFMDGDFELSTPAPIAIEGRVHTNGNFYLSGNNSNNILFTKPITIAKQLFNSAAVSSGSGIGGAQVQMPTGTGSAFLRSTPALPEATDAAQSAYLSTTFGTQVQDRSMGQEPLNVPINISGRTACTSTCSGSLECVKRLPTDATGFCMPRVSSRPSVCESGPATGARSNFAQSLAIEVIKRPAKLYESTSGGLYDDGVANTDIFTADYGLTFSDAGAPTGIEFAEQTVTRSVPITNIVEADDDAGATKERMYWKADIRIIDGVWYKKGSNTPVFNPETWDFSTASFVPNAMTGRVDLGHKFARVLRYSWFWDPREGREFSAGDRYQRGLQIRATDFDVASFRELLADGSARSLLFAGGAVPSGGVIVYISETYDPTYEDANTIAPRAANVRNFLDFYVMENHVGSTVTIPVNASATTPAGRGWFASNIWGRNAPTGHHSLTVPQDSTGAAIAALTTTSESAATGDALKFRTAYRAPSLYNGSLAQWAATDGCQEPSLLTSAPMPTSATGSVVPPCIQSGATPLGAENAVRIVRAQGVPDEGLTIATDNRAYIYGDVNVINTGGTAKNAKRFDGTTVATNQRIGGKVSILADSVTLLSSRFSDRVMQRGSGGGSTGTSDVKSIAQLPHFTGAAYKQDGSALALPGGTLPWGSETPGEDGDAGAAPNLCGVAKNLSTTGAVSGTGVNVRLTLPTLWPANANLRKALPTRFNTSLLMGDVPACLSTNTNVGNSNGGVNNFPRFVENWQSTDNVIFGSMVSLFRSERGNARFLTSNMDDSYAGGGFVTNNWVGQRKAAAYEGGSGSGFTHCVYTPPVRDWAFDDALTNPLNLPPGTPRVFANDRIRWVRR